ncbi:hypothetical protein TI04_08180, partial [Achromatium sp. WMS2]
LFIDSAQKLGIATLTLPRLTFGTHFADFNNDGKQDLILVNGHIEPSIQKVQSAVTYQQPLDIFIAQQDGKLKSLAELTGKPITDPMVGRCVAVGDIDGDKDIDAIVSVNGGSPVILRNTTGGQRSILIDLKDNTTSNLEALGAKVTLSNGTWSSSETVRARGSYLGHSPYTLHFGIPQQVGTNVHVTIRWPDGTVADQGTISIANHYQIVRNGQVQTLTSR